MWTSAPVLSGKLERCNLLFPGCSGAEQEVPVLSFEFDFASMHLMLHITGCRVAQYSGLLLQHFQETVCSHLAALEQGMPKLLEEYDEEARERALAALTQLLVCAPPM